MSYQPQQPAGGWPPMQGGGPPAFGGPPPGYGPSPVAPQPAHAPSTGQRAGGGNKGLLYASLGVLVVGVLVGAALFLMSGSAEEETVKEFARAPGGCTTTLQFDKRSTFTFYVETKGTITDVGGDCAANGSSFEYSGDGRPEVALTLVDEDDQEVALTDVSGPSYNVGGFVGSGVHKAVITEPGTYRLTVAATSDDSEFAVAVGGAPDADSSTMKTAGIAAGLAGLVLGGLLLLAWKRKQGPGSGGAVATPQWQPAGTPPYAPTGPVPGYAAPPSAPTTYPPQQPNYPPQQPNYPPQQPNYPPAPPPAGGGWGAPQQ